MVAVVGIDDGCDVCGGRGLGVLWRRLGREREAARAACVVICVECVHEGATALVAAALGAADAVPAKGSH